MDRQLLDEDSKSAKGIVKVQFWLGAHPERTNTTSLEYSTDLKTWKPLITVGYYETSQKVTVTSTGQCGFFRTVTR